MAKPSKQKRLPYAPSPHMVYAGDTVNTQRYDDVYERREIGSITALTPLGTQRFRVVSDGDLKLRIEFWEADVVRFFYGFRDTDDDFSYARDPAAKPAGVAVETTESATHFTLTTETLRVAIDRTDGSVTITNPSGQELHRYAAPFRARTTLMQGLDQMRLQLHTPAGEAFFGLGDKAWDADLHGRYFENWNSDAFAYGKERSELYRSVPFYYGLRGGNAYGIFVDNGYRSHFDFNSNDDGLTTLWTDGGEFDYYFFNGPELDEVAARYTRLTGLPELPPLWALGYHQCRWSYYPEKRVKEVAATFREQRIPCDAIYLDIDYMDGYRCFTWNKEHFPDPKRMIAELHDDHFHTVVMIDPGIRVDEDYHVYREGVERDAFCRRSTGERMVGPVWPQECVWPDYTNPEVRQWWGQLYRELYVEQGVSGFWNDMNEPAMFQVNALTFPLDVRHDYDGHGGDHKKAHNIYGMQMTRATHDGLRSLQPDKRPFLLARASFSGGQRFASVWTGDNIASWEHLAIANRQCVRMSISGYSFVGTDIGGFVDDPSPELLTRWLQLSVFHPFMRIHSMGNNTDGAAEAEADEVKKAEAENRQDQEPWVHGGVHTDNNRAAIELRYRLLPYLYTAFRRHLEDGKPVFKNLFFYDQRDANCLKYADQFLFGDDLVVCPVVKPDQKRMKVYLPRGDWFDFYTGKPVSGGKESRVELRADRLPIYVRAGAVLPTVAPAQHTHALLASKTLELSCYLADSCSGTLYWDAGDGYGYRGDDYCRRTFTGQRVGYRGFELRQQVEGSFVTPFETIELRLFGGSGSVDRVSVDGQSVQAGADGTFTVPVDFATLSFD